MPRRHTRHSNKQSSSTGGTIGYDPLYHAPLNVDTIRNRQCTWIFNKWDPQATTFINLLPQREFNWAQNCIGTSLCCIFSPLCYGCDGYPPSLRINSMTMTGPQGEWKVTVPSQFADLITSEEWERKFTKIDTAIQEWIGPGKFKRALGELCYCVPGVGKLFDEFDEKGYGEYVNVRRKEARALLMPIVESFSDDRLIWSLEWAASYPEEGCMYKDEVDQLVERDAWKNLTDLPSGFSVSLKVDAASPPDLVPIEEFSYNLNLVIRRRHPPPDFVKPAFEIDPNDPVLAFMPGFEFLPSVWRVTAQSNGRRWQTLNRSQLGEPLPEQNTLAFAMINTPNPTDPYY